MTNKKKTEWSPERKAAASARMKEVNEVKKRASSESKMRVPVGQNRDITNVHDTPEGYKDRWVNDEAGRIEKFRAAGYESVETAQMDSSNVDGSHTESGVVSKDMGKGQTAYLMRQRQDYYDEDQIAKQITVDETEDSMRKTKIKSHESTDGNYGEVKIG